MARQLRIGNTLTCPGMKVFSSIGAMRERAKDSYLLFPSIVRHFRPPRVHSSMTLLIGASLQTLQHHLKSFAGGPKLERFSQKASPPYLDKFDIVLFAELPGKLHCLREFDTSVRKKYFTDFFTALLVRSSVVRLSFPR